MEDDFDVRQPSIKYNWNMILDGRQTKIEDDLRRKTTFEEN